MGKSTKTYEERIQEKDLRIEKLAQELKRYEAQKKQLEKRKKEEERKIRTHRLIEIGAAVESVLGRCIELEAGEWRMLAAEELEALKRAVGAQ